MGHRLYDPLTGRMLSADPIVQEPFNLQNLNRYSYVLNNPLSYTDPTGLSFVRKYWRQIVQIAATIVTGGISNVFLAMAANFAVGTAVTGSLRGGLIAAFSAAVFHGIGGHFAEVAAANRKAVEGFTGVLGTGLKAAQFATQIGAHAMAGGVISVMQGGKFGHGFISAGATKAASPWINSIGDGARAMAPARVATAALVGGTVSAATGGKFANGAVTAAFQQAWNGERGLGEKATDFYGDLVNNAGEVLEPAFQALDASMTAGENAAQSWANTAVNADNPFAAAGAHFMGGLASLWTHGTAGSTALTLIPFGGGAGAHASRPFWRYVGPMSRDSSPWLTRRMIGSSAPYGTDFIQARNALQLPYMPNAVQAVRVPWNQPVIGPGVVYGNAKWGYGGA